MMRRGPSGRRLWPLLFALVASRAAGQSESPRAGPIPQTTPDRPRSPTPSAPALPSVDPAGIDLLPPALTPGATATGALPGFPPPDGPPSATRPAGNDGPRGLP